MTAGPHDSPSPCLVPPGLGKTLQTISLLGYLKESRGISGPHLIITPKSTLSNWYNECRRWCPSLVVVKFQGDKATRAKVKEQHFDVEPQFDVCLTTYESVIQEQGAQPGRAPNQTAQPRHPPSKTAPCTVSSACSLHSQARVALPHYRRGAPHQEREVCPIDARPPLHDSLSAAHYRHAAAKRLARTVGDAQLSAARHLRRCAPPLTAAADIACCFCLLCCSGCHPTEPPTTPALAQILIHSTHGSTLGPRAALAAAAATAPRVTLLTFSPNSTRFSALSSSAASRRMWRRTSLQNGRSSSS